MAGAESSPSSGAAPRRSELDLPCGEACFSLAVPLYEMSADLTLEDIATLTRTLPLPSVVTVLDIPFTDTVTSWFLTGFPFLSLRMTENAFLFWLTSVWIDPEVAESDFATLAEAAPFDIVIVAVSLGSETLMLTDCPDVSIGLPFTETVA